jgi:hypothetical protein
MLLYAMAVLPLIDSLEQTSIEVKQNWYADDASATGPLTQIKHWFEDLMLKGPAYGYYPEPEKSYLVVDPSNVDKAREIFGNLGVRVVNGQRFLGGYVGDVEGKTVYASKKVQEWVECVEKLTKVGAHQPQAAFAALVKSLQCEWNYLQTVALLFIL